MKYKAKWKLANQAQAEPQPQEKRKQFNKKRRLTWYRWEWQDPIHPDMWTACTCSVYQPTYELPFVSVLVSIANGGGKVLFRCSSLEQAQQRIVIPDEGIERLQLAITKAQGYLEDIQEDLRLILNAHTLEGGGQIVRTDTGEILAEAERIIAQSGEHD